MIAIANPSGCTHVQATRRRTRSAKRPTLLQRIARAFAAPAAAMVERLDRLGSRA